jgi:xanthine dehydrogenase YagR molybdenum-binding subunit
LNARGIKGVGEIGITGSAGAVANAVRHATGIRVRRFPIRIEDPVTPASNILDSKPYQ